MHPIFKRLALFLLVVVAVNAGITWYFNHISIANHKLLKQDRKFHNAPDDIDILVMGHSRPGVALNDRLLPNAVNFCSGGESNIHTYYKLKYVLEESGKKVKTVVLPAGFGSFNLPDVEVNANSFYWKRYVDYLKLGEETGEFSTYLSVWLKAHLVPWYEYPYLRLQVALGDFDLSIDKEAYAASSDAEKLEIARGIINQQMSSRNQYDSVSISYVKRTLELCKEHNVMVVYVNFPVSSYYETAAKEVIDEHGFSDKFVQIAEMIARSENGVLFDFTTSDLEMGDDLFSDPQHMTKEGQQKFTTYFLELLQPDAEEEQEEKEAPAKADNFAIDYSDVSYEKFIGLFKQQSVPFTLNTDTLPIGWQNPIYGNSYKRGDTSLTAFPAGFIATFLADSIFGSGWYSLYDHSQLVLSDYARSGSTDGRHALYPWYKFNLDNDNIGLLVLQWEQYSATNGGGWKVWWLQYDAMGKKIACEKIAEHSLYTSADGWENEDTFYWERSHTCERSDIEITTTGVGATIQGFRFREIQLNDSSWTEKKRLSDELLNINFTPH